MAPAAPESQEFEPAGYAPRRSVQSLDRSNDDA
jgi:hypothetical protein